MSENVFDPNQLTMMFAILTVHTKHLKDEVSELKLYEVEQRWKEILSTLHSCFAYIQSNNINIMEYREDIKEILDNLYTVEKVINDKKSGKITVVDDVAKSVAFIAERIDDVLEGVGLKRVVGPITVAIFEIPKRILSMVSNGSYNSAVLSDAVQRYLPPPITDWDNEHTLENTLESEDGEIIDVDWVDVGAKESFARQLLRQMHERIDHIESGKE